VKGLNPAKPHPEVLGVRALKVLIANDTYLPQLNGAAVAAHRLVQGLAKRGHQVTVVAPNMSYRDEEEEDPTVPGVSIHRIRSFPTRPVHPEFRVASWAGIDAKLDRIFRQCQPDIVHLQNHFVIGRGCMRQGRKRGLPVVGTNHFMPENLLDYFPKPLRPAGSAVMWKHWRRVYNRLDCVLAPSHACLSLLRSAGMTAPARVISNGIDLQRFSRLPASDDIYEKYAIRRNVPTFLAVGRLDKDKKVDLVIRATARAAATTQMQTVIVGKGKAGADLRSLARRLGPEGAVVFTGYVPDEDLPSLYSLADIYIGAGIAELQGLAVMEAMAVGLPALAADAVALPELVQDGFNGFLFELTTEDLADKMLLMLDHRDRWQAMADNSVATIQQHDMPRVLAQVEELYEELTSVPGRPYAGSR
jgi:glycosyltransferase involved in cell wall biosynthesis